MDKTYKLRLTDAERATWQAAADQANLPLATWMRRTLTCEAVGENATKAVIAAVDDVRKEPCLDLCARCYRIGAPTCNRCKALTAKEDDGPQF